MKARHDLTDKSLSKNQIRSIEKKFSREFIASQQDYLREELEKYKDIPIVVVNQNTKEKS